MASEFPSGEYRTIYIDPPWPEYGGGRIKRGAQAHYKLMSLEKIKALPVSGLCHPEGAHIYLWTTNRFLPDAIECLKGWGFEYVTAIVWVKDRIGLGQYYRGKSEICLFGTTRKKLPYKLDESDKRCQGVTAFYEAKREHSRKPEQMRKMIERVSYGPRIEVFARERFPGWDAYGDELT